MAKKKKNLILLLVLCIILAGFIILYFLVPQKRDEESGTEEAESITVDKIDNTLISSLVIEKEGKEIYSVRKKEDTWQFPEETGIPLDHDTISGLFGCLNPVKASREIHLAEDQDLTQYGLDDPVMTIKVETEDGKSYQYKLGTVVPITGGYYGLSASGDTVYCFGEEMYSTFDIEKNSLIQMEELPEINASHITYLKVENKEGDDFEAALGEDKKNWSVVRPYTKIVEEGDSQWDTVREYFTSLSYDSLAEYKSDQLEKYGLNDPSSVISIKYYEKKDGAESSGDTTSGNAAGEIAELDREYKSLKLCIGKSCEEGYYVCEEGSSNVYIMAEDMVKNMTQVDEYGLK